MAQYISNAFSLNMLTVDEGDQCQVTVRRLSLENARKMALEATSTIGHADTATLFSNVLNTQVSWRRSTLELHSGDQLLVGQYKGPRLPEGCSQLPDGATIQWFRISLTSCCL